MPNVHSSKKQGVGKGKLDISFKKPEEKAEERYRYSYIPISFYWLKDIIRGFLSHKNFPDALAIAFATFSVSIAFPFFPPILLIPLILITFVITMVSPLSGLMAMLFETLPMFIYQAPLLAWILTLFVSVSLFVGYKHYRTVTFIYALIMLPMSYLGYYLEVPAFIIGILFIGFRRSIVSTIIIILLVAMLSGLTGIQNSAPIVYNAASAHNSLTKSASYMVPSMTLPSIGQFPYAFASALSTFFSLNIATQIFNGFGIALSSIAYNIEFSALQIIVWLFVVFAMTNYVIKSRSAYKGTESSIFSFIMLGMYIFLTYYTGVPRNNTLILSFLATPLVIFFLEFNNIEVVRALSVMKQDFLGKFGEAFQDLTSGTKETLNDVANYDETKKELREAILAPIEHREISGAYNVKPAKGLLLFGPPGTGKTLIMRALSNEIRAKFFYVKTSSILSPFQGESAQTLSKIFSTVRKNVPAVLFFDEIDGISPKRSEQESDSGRQLLSTLLSEMDGFQKLDGVVIVGSTNVPELIDEGLLRPGRFDKIIYMPLPDKSGRAKIFNYYMSKLPIGNDISYSKLAELTNRYSGADIKNICNEVARQVADEAVKQRKVLQVTMADVVRIIKLTKPSTSIANLDKYNQFKIDYERRTHPELISTKEGNVTLDDVVGLEDAKKALYEAVEIPILHPNLIKKYDVQSIKGILMFGPPGTGKTLLMKAVADELDGVSLIIMSGAELAKNGIENSLSEIKDTFNRARENAPCILFVDEIDALLLSRSTASEFSIKVTSEFLQELDGMKSSSGVILVGATNRPEKIDPAVLRPGRIDKFIFVPPPGAKEREEIFKENLIKAPIAKNLEFKKLSEETEGYTGADIANICRQAKLTALEKNLADSSESEIKLKDILDVVHSMKPSAPSSTLGNYMNFLSLYGGR